MKLSVNYDISRIADIVSKKLERVNLLFDGMVERVVYSPSVYKALCAMVKKDTKWTSEVEKIIDEAVLDLVKEVEEYSVDSSGLDLKSATSKDGKEQVKFEDALGEPCSLTTTYETGGAGLLIGIEDVLPGYYIDGKWVELKNVPNQAQFSSQMLLSSTQLAQLVPRLVDFVVKENLGEDSD